MSSPILLIAQETDTLISEKETAFRKGRWFTGLSGSIYTSSIDDSFGRNSGSDNDAFGYTFDITTGQFIADRSLLGLLLFIEKQNTNDVLYRDVESLLIGPFYRYYFSDQSIGSMYTGIAFGYNGYIDDHNIDFQNQLFEERIRGNGIGLIGEVGYGLNLNDNICFDLSINYLAQYVSGNFTNFQDEEMKVDFWRKRFLFKFGFNVILDEFFF